MSRFTSVSPYRQWDVRFGNRPHGIDTTVRTYQLTPDQLERLRNGENLDDILKDCKNVKEEKDMSNKKIDLTIEEYVEMNKKGMEGDSMKKSSGEVVTYYLSPEELEQVRNKRKKRYYPRQTQQCKM